MDLYRFGEILRKAAKVGNAVRDGGAAARVRGACIGRKPLDCDPGLVAATVSRYGSIRKAAAVLGVSPSTILSRLARVDEPLEQSRGGVLPHVGLADVPLRHRQGAVTQEPLDRVYVTPPG